MKRLSQPNYLKQFIRRTTTKYGTTRKGLPFQELSYPIHFIKNPREQRARVEAFHRMKYGMGLLDVIILRLIARIEKEKEKNMGKKVAA